MDFSKGMAGRAAITRLAFNLSSVISNIFRTYILFYKQLTGLIFQYLFYFTAYFLLNYLHLHRAVVWLLPCEALLVTDYGQDDLRWVWFVFFKWFYQRGFYHSMLTQFIIREQVWLHHIGIGWYDKFFSLAAEDHFLSPLTVIAATVSVVVLARKGLYNRYV